MIAFLISELDIRGGTHKQFLELLNYADSQHVKFKVLTSHVDYTKTYPGFAKYADRIVEIGPIGRKSWWMQIWKIRRLLKDVSVVNIHDNGFQYVLMAFAGKRVVWQVNDLYPLFKEGVSKDRCLSKSDYLKILWIRVTTWLFVDQVTVNVSKNAERVKKQLGKNARVLYCGISPIDICHNNEMTFNRFRQKKIRLLSSGVFFPYRNYETLVNAVAQLRRHGVDATLNIFGSYSRRPDYYKTIQSQIDSMGLSGFIKILGQVDECTYQKLHEESDVFCFVNVDQSWGLAVFEAMSAGLPVVVSKSVGATEILHDGEDALFVDPMNADMIASRIEGLMEDHARYANIQGNGLRLVQSYSWRDAYCKPMLQLLNG